MSHELPILNQISIPTPCPASWDEMSGDERSRHCAQCDKQVFHLSMMTADDAAAVVQEHQGNLCARIRVRSADGTLVTQPPRRKRNWLVRLLRRTVAAAAAVPLALFASGCSRDAMPDSVAEWFGPDEDAWVVTGIVAPEEEELQGDVEIMGDIAVPEPPPASDTDSQYQHEAQASDTNGDANA